MTGLDSHGVEDPFTCLVVTDNCGCWEVGIETAAAEEDEEEEEESGGRIVEVRVWVTGNAWLETGGKGVCTYFCAG